jgi:hypothetical protein
MGAAGSYYRFYFRFIAPQRGAIDRSLGHQVVESITTVSADDLYR